MANSSPSAPGKIQTHSVAAEPLPELDLLLHTPAEQGSRLGLAFGLSLLAHLLLLGVGVPLLALLPNTPPSMAHNVRRRIVTPLFLPPDVLTQRERNRNEISKSFDLANLQAARDTMHQLRAPTPNPEKPKQKSEIARLNTRRDVKRDTAPAITAEPPRDVAGHGTPAPGVPESVIGAPPPTPAPQAPLNPMPSAGAEDAKANSNPGSIASPTSNASSRLAPPKNSLSDVMQQMSKRDSRSQVTVSDEIQAPNIPVSPGQQGAPPKMSSQVELQSDPQGADFRPYLTKVLGIVRRNWFTVVPNSARMGVLRGRTTVQFVINRDGSIPKLVIADSSGLQPLDRAAVAGLSMSNPLPPLPPEFKGGFIRLQFSFSYHVGPN